MNKYTIFCEYLQVNILLRFNRWVWLHQRHKLIDFCYCLLLLRWKIMLCCVLLHCGFVARCIILWKHSVLSLNWMLEWFQEPISCTIVNVLWLECASNVPTWNKKLGSTHDSLIKFYTLLRLTIANLWLLIRGKVKGFILCTSVTGSYKCSTKVEF